MHLPELHCTTSAWLRHCAFHIHLVKHTAGQPASTERYHHEPLSTKVLLLHLKWLRLRPSWVLKWELHLSYVDLMHLFSCVHCVLGKIKKLVFWRCIIFLNYVSFYPVSSQKQVFPWVSHQKYDVSDTARAGFHPQTW